MSEEENTRRDAETDELMKMVERTADQLGEHFDSVRIFCTRHGLDGTHNTKALDAGRGNLYAQLGQIHEWLSIQDQFQRNWAIRKDAEDQ